MSDDQALREGGDFVLYPAPRTLNVFDAQTNPYWVESRQWQDIGWRWAVRRGERAIAYCESEDEARTILSAMTSRAPGHPESEKVRREVAAEMAHWYPPERSMEDPATVRRIAEWRAKLLEGLEAE